MDKQCCRKWIKKIKKSLFNNKDKMFLSSLDAGIDPEKLIIGIITDLPKGDYRFSTIVDLVFDDYGPMLCYSIRKEHFLGLSAISSDRNEKINGKLFHASFTHDLEKINIT